jgi:hypothetical protein
MRVIVDENGWGNGSPGDVVCLLDNVSRAFLGNFTDPPQGTVRVQHNIAGPRVLYREPGDDEYVVWLSCRDRYWSQYSYQFAHELCHIASNYEQLLGCSNNWFHETLCELSSLCVLKSMAISWHANPPFRNWIDYACSLNAYADNLIHDPRHQVPSDVSFRNWITSREESLRRDPCQRSVNIVVAIRLFSLFRQHSTQWQTIRYLPTLDGPLAEYVHAWLGVVPDRHKGFVSEVAALLQTG